MDRWAEVDGIASNLSMSIATEQEFCDINCDREV